MTSLPDLSMWPPALVFSLVVIVLVCHVLPDVLRLAPKETTSLPSSGTVTSSAKIPTGGSTV